MQVRSASGRRCRQCTPHIRLGKVCAGVSEEVRDGKNARECHAPSSGGTPLSGRCSLHGQLELRILPSTETLSLLWTPHRCCRYLDGLGCRSTRRLFLEFHVRPEQRVPSLVERFLSTNSILKVFLATVRNSSNQFRQSSTGEQQR